MPNKIFSRHFEQCVAINADPAAVFAFADNHANFSAHMNESSWMMGGGSMTTSTDEGRGQIVGSHIRMTGKVLGLDIYLDEIVTLHESPYRKSWETVGDLRLLVIGDYRMGFEITPKNEHSLLRVFIDYNLPATKAWLGKLFGNFYARWCVRQMAAGVQNRFH